MLFYFVTVSYFTFVTLPPNINILKPEIHLNNIQNLIPSSRKTQYVTITNWLMLFREIMGKT
jgi:hypothetical protein